MKSKLSNESITALKETIEILKSDERIKWGISSLIDSINVEQRLYSEAMTNREPTHSAAHLNALNAEYNKNVIMFCERKIKLSNTWKNQTISKLLDKKLSYYTNKDGSIFDKTMAELVEWDDDNRIAKKIQDVKAYSQGRIEKYRKKGLI